MPAKKKLSRKKLQQLAAAREARQRKIAERKAMAVTAPPAPRGQLLQNLLNQDRAAWAGTAEAHLKEVATRLFFSGQDREAAIVRDAILKLEGK